MGVMCPWHRTGLALPVHTWDTRHRCHTDLQRMVRSPRDAQAGPGLALLQVAGTGSAGLLLGLRGGPEPLLEEAKVWGWDKRGFSSLGRGREPAWARSSWTGRKGKQRLHKKRNGSCWRSEHPWYSRGAKSHRRGRGEEQTHHTPVGSPALFQPRASHGKRSVPPKSLKSPTGFTRREVLLRDRGF